LIEALTTNIEYKETIASKSTSTFKSVCFLKAILTKHLDVMATKNHTTLHDFIAVLEGQNTKNNGQRERKHWKPYLR